MKKIVLILLISCAGVNAQSGKHEKIKALKTAYITEKLTLSPKEAEAFWPIYNSYDERFHALRKQEKTEIFLPLRNGVENLSDAEANNLIDKSIELQNKELALHKQMTTELRQVISPKKIIILKKTEEDFKRELLERYRHSKDEKGQKNP